MSRRIHPALAGVISILASAAVALVLLILAAPGIGDACWSDENGDECRVLFGQHCVGDVGGDFCSHECESDADCPAGLRCREYRPIDPADPDSPSVFCMRTARRAPPPELLRSGRSTVSQLIGSLPGVAVGDECRWSQQAMGSDGAETYWMVSCGSVDVYDGFLSRDDPSWPAGTFAADWQTSSQDRNSSFVFTADEIVVADDDAGAHGGFELTLTNQ